MTLKFLFTIYKYTLDRFAFLFLENKIILLKKKKEYRKFLSEKKQVFISKFEEWSQQPMFVVVLGVDRERQRIERNIRVR